MMGRVEDFSGGVYCSTAAVICLHPWFILPTQLKGQLPICICVRSMVGSGAVCGAYDLRA